MSVLHDEIFEQPGCVRQFLDRETGVINTIAQVVNHKPFDYILIAARGTSDNAARYGQYLFGMMNRVPVALAAPSLFTVYHTPPHLERALVIGISQSGQSPDVVQVIEEANRQGAPTIAITNDAASPLATTARHHIHLGVGPERSVAATKTYTTELTALALLSCELARQTQPVRQMRAIPTLMEQALEAEREAEQAAHMLAGFERSVVIGRGFNYATAYELALKVKELAYVEAEPYSAADFKHGPIALADPGTPAVLVSVGEAFRAEMEKMARELRERGSRLVVLTDDANHCYPDFFVPLPSEMPEWLSPLYAILPGQLLAYHLSIARGHNPDQPRTIQKVTLTY